MARPRRSPLEQHLSFLPTTFADPCLSRTPTAKSVGRSVTLRAGVGRVHAPVVLPDAEREPGPDCLPHSLTKAVPPRQVPVLDARGCRARRRGRRRERSWEEHPVGERPTKLDKPGMRSRWGEAHEAAPEDQQRGHRGSSGADADQRADLQLLVTDAPPGPLSPAACGVPGKGGRLDTGREPRSLEASDSESSQPGGNIQCGANWGGTHAARSAAWRKRRKSGEATGLRHT